MDIRKKLLTTRVVITVVSAFALHLRFIADSESVPDDQQGNEVGHWLELLDARGQKPVTSRISTPDMSRDERIVKVDMASATQSNRRRIGH